MGRGRSISEARRERIVRLHHHGLKLRQIGDVVGVSHQSVANILDECGEERKRFAWGNRPDFTKRDREIARLHRMGYVAREIGEKVGVSTSQAGRILLAKGEHLLPCFALHKNHDAFKRGKRLYESGLTTEEVAQKIGRPARTLHGWLMAAGVKRRSKGSRGKRGQT